MTGPVDLDDAPALLAADPSDLLRAVATGAAQVREAVVLSGEAGLAGLRDEGRPRAVVVCGTGASAVAGDVLAALSGPACPVPVLPWRGLGLPAWVGAADLVVAVSCSGRTEETLSALEEAVRRGCRLLVVGAAGSPLEALAARGRAVFVPVPQGRPPRTAVWALSVPLLVAGDALGLLRAPGQDLEEAATVLEQVAAACRPDSESVLNPGKALALELDGALPLVWGASPLAGAVAARFARRLAEDAAVPAVWGVLPEAGHDQVAVLDGAWGGGSPAAQDLFRDRVDEPDPVRVRLVLLREDGELPTVARQADACAALARERGVGVSALRASGRSAPARLASLLGLTDFASAYLALAQGTDPTPVAAVAALSDRTRR